MMIRKCVLILICVITLLSTTGCWSRKELNELAIVLAMGIDKSDELFRISIQVVEPEQVSSQKAGGGNRAPVTTYHTEAHTITEALRKITTDVPRKPFLAHLRMLVIGEEVAREGLNSILDALSRNNEFRMSFFIIIAKNAKALDVLSINTELEKLPANTLYDALKTSEAEWAPTKSMTLDRLINNLTISGEHPVITGIKLVGNVEKGKTRENVDEVVSESYLKYEELAVFQGAKLVGWLNTEESKGYNYITGNLRRTAGHLNCPDGSGAISNEIKKVKTKMKAVYKNGKPHINIHVWGDATIAEVSCRIDLKKQESIVYIEKKMNERIEKLMKMAIQTAQEQYKADIFGFGQEINSLDSKLWRKLQKNWDEHFVDLPVTLYADVKIRNLGTINNSFIEHLNKVKEGK